MNLKKHIREIENFPKPGISFKDLTTLFKNSEALSFSVKSIVDEFKNKNITKVLGIESRGFIIGGIVAHELSAGFVPVRKKGKLPASTIFETYELEYGIDTVEMHSDAVSENDVVLIHDDLLATGGTAYAVLKLVKQKGVKNIFFSFICDLEFIVTPGKEKLKEYEMQVLVKY